jgi:hypothetical protein
VRRHPSRCWRRQCTCGRCRITSRSGGATGHSFWFAVAQGLYALGLLRWPPSRAYFLLGVAGNLALAILWLVTRTTGIPLLGPHAGEVERVGVLDLACTVAEVGIVAGLGALAIKDLPTEGRIQVVVVAAATSLLFWHLLHLLAGSSSH